MNPGHAIPSYVLKIYFLIFPSKLMSSRWFLSYKICQQTLWIFLLSLFLAFRSSFHHHHPWCDHHPTIIIIINEKHKSCYFFLVCRFIHSYSATAFDTNIPASILFSNTLSVKGQVSHPEKGNKNYSFLYF